MFKEVIKIRENAEVAYYKYLEVNLQPLLNTLIKDLQQLYPSRNIYMIFGNGTCFVNFSGSANYNPCVDSYGNLNSFYEAGGSSYNVHFFRRFEEGHPLMQLMKILDELYDMKGYTPPLVDIK